MKIHKHIFITIFLAILALFSSCERSELTKDEANKIFLQVKNRNPAFCEPIIIDRTADIIGMYEKESEFGTDIVACLLTRVAGNWQIKSELTAAKGGENQELRNDFELTTIGGKRYIYFSRKIIHYGTAYNGLDQVDFMLYSPHENRFMALEYSGNSRSEGKIEGSFENLSDFRNKLELLTFLEGKAAQSNVIYKPATSQMDINNIVNYEKKWLRENPDIYETRKDVWKPIVFCYYSEKLFPDTADKDSAEKRIKNVNYIISTSFGGPVLGYDNKDKNYFVIWIPQGMGAGGMWGARSYKAQFKTANSVIISNDFHEIEIDLKSKRFRVIAES